MSVRTGARRAMRWFGQLSHPRTPRVLLRLHCFQMGRPNTTRSSTQMVHVETRRNGAVSQFVGESVGLSGESAVVEAPVSELILRSRPDPAVAGLVDLRPKAAFCGSALGASGSPHAVVVEGAEAFRVNLGWAPIGRTRADAGHYRQVGVSMIQKAAVVHVTEALAVAPAFAAFHRAIADWFRHNRIILREAM